MPSDLAGAVVNMMDGFFYMLGIFLICFATVIISGLTYAFFYVVLPMIQRANPNNPLWVSLNVAFVAFLLINVLSNYFWCISTKNKGPLYDTVVRELAEETGFVYPETPDDVLQYKADFEEKMIFRMQRRQARRTQIAEQQQQLQQEQLQISSTSSESGGMTQRKATGEGASATLPPAPQQVLPVRRWIIMGPHEWGFCTKSNQPKPPRSHFDSVTQQLVLNMDHYCPWMFNTIGYFNYRYFCNFLLFVLIGMTYGACITWRPFFAIQSIPYLEQIRLSKQQHASTTLHLFDYVPTPHERSAIAFSFLLCLSVGVAVLVLCGFHTYLVLTGQTTIEFHGNCANHRRAKLANKKYKNPYDMGMKRNFQQVYGTGNPLVAMLVPSNREPEFLPVPIPGKDGLRPKYGNKKDPYIVDNDPDVQLGIV